MLKRRILLICALVVSLLLLDMVTLLDAQSPNDLSACKDFAFSTEEDFLTQGPTPPDGNPIISDGDLLGRAHAVCARNRQLLAAWEIGEDLGLDAADVIDVEREWVAFSTELDDPQGRFKAGDLLATNGTNIPNAALLTLFQVGNDLGLDAVHFVGQEEQILAFLQNAAEKAPDDWLDGNLIESLQQYEIDIWFSTEGTELTASTVQILDGDLLSARTGTVILDQTALLPAAVPAGIPDRGVDFGLDAVSAARPQDAKSVRFSTEILYRKEPLFNDGDILRAGNGVEIHHSDLVTPFEPLAKFLGIDALYMRFVRGQNDMYLPVILKNYSGEVGR